MSYDERLTQSARSEPLTRSPLDSALEGIPPGVPHTAHFLSVDDAERHELAAPQCPLCPVFWGPQNAQIIVAQSCGSCPLRVDRHLPSLPLRLILTVSQSTCSTGRTTKCLSVNFRVSSTRVRTLSVALGHSNDVRMAFEGRSKGVRRIHLEMTSRKFLARATSICSAPRTLRQILTSEPIITCAAIHTVSLSGFLGSLSGFCRRAVQFSGRAVQFLRC